MSDTDALGDPLSSASVRPLVPLWLIPAAVLLVAAALLGWASIQEYRQIVEDEYRFLDAHARMGQSRIETLVRSVSHLLAHIENEVPARRKTSDDYNKELALHREEVPEIHTLAVIDAKGRVELSAKPDLVGFDGSGREYFTTHRDDPRSGFRISRPYKSRYGQYSVAFSVPVRDKQQNLLAIVVAGVHYTYFADVMKEVRPESPGAAATVVNAHGDVLYRDPSPEDSVGKSFLANAVFQDFVQDDRRTTRGVSISPNDGIERMYVFRAVAGTGVNIGVSRPLDEVLAPWRRDLMLRAGLFALGSVLVLGLVLTALRRQREAMAGREFLGGLIETANTLIVGVDEDGRIFLVNDAAERITGYRREELLGGNLFETLTPRERFPQVWQIYLETRRGGRLPRSIEAPILTKEGDERVIAWQNSRRFKHGGSWGMLSFGIDMTQRLELQEARSREEVSRRLVQVQEEERRRLAVELHDRTSPNLSALDMQLRLLAKSLPSRTSPTIESLLQDAEATLADTIASIRAIAHDFRPPLLDYAGLWPAVNAYARQFNRRTGIAVALDGQEPAVRHDAEAETNLFHIVQEALANCAKHSNAETVSIRQAASGDELVLTVEDDGVGFDPEECTKGRGLLSMRQRAQFIGGRLAVDSRPGRGTRVAVRFSALRTAACCQAPQVSYPAISHADAPSPAARPLEKQAVSR